MIDQRSAECTGHATFLRLLDILRPALVSTVESFYNDQIATMLDTRYSCKKRVGIFPTVATLPSFVQHYEQVAKLAADDSATRQLVGLVEERLAAALFRNLAGLAAEGDAVGAGIGDDEDKGRLNAAVMIIGTHVVASLCARKSAPPDARGAAALLPGARIRPIGSVGGAANVRREHGRLRPALLHPHHRQAPCKQEALLTDRSLWRHC